MLYISEKDIQRSSEGEVAVVKLAPPGARAETTEGGGGGPRAPSGGEGR